MFISKESREKIGWRKGKIFTAFFKSCEVCGTKFKTVPTSSKQFCCSYKCMGIKKRKWPQEKFCLKCGVKFLAKEIGIKFCSRGHSFRNRKITIRDIRPKIIERANNSCEQCGWNIEPKILEVHHKDRNKNNNEFSNLILVCPNCHESNHLKERTGRFRYH